MAIPVHCEIMGGGGVEASAPAPYSYPSDYVSSMHSQVDL